MIDLCLIRHGETEANRSEIRQGHCDYPLTMEGVNDAKVTGSALRHVKWAHLYASDLNRARTTAAIILDESQFHDASSVSVTPLLREVKFGMRDGFHKNLKKSEIRAIIAASKNIAPEDVVDDSETDEQVHKRQSSFLREIAARVYQTEYIQDKRNEIPRILAVSHGRFIKQFLNNFSCFSALQLAPPEILRDSKLLSISNCSVTIVRIRIPLCSPPPSVCVHARELEHADEADFGPAEREGSMEATALLVNWTKHLCPGGDIDNIPLSPECSWILPPPAF